MIYEAPFDIEKQQPFQINAIVIMPNHLHCLWVLLPEDSDYSIRWNRLKGGFLGKLILKREFEKADKNGMSVVFDNADSGRI
jgi:REP element-mobilizing transposase RayT